MSSLNRCHTTFIASQSLFFRFHPSNRTHYATICFNAECFKYMGNSAFGTVSIPSQYVFESDFQWVMDAGFSPIIQGQFFTDYEGDTMASDFNVAVRFLTPLNEYLTIIQNIVF